jgi:hypothetical protein
LIHVSGHTLIYLTLTAWGAVGAEVAIDFLSDGATTALIAGAMAIGVGATITRHAERMEASNRALAASIEGCVHDLGEDLKVHVLTVERFVAIAYRSDALARIDAAEAHAAAARGDTGPFPAVNHRSNLS